MPDKNSKFKIKRSLPFVDAKGQNSKLNVGGFSLVELLIALVIISLVTAVAIPNLRNFNRGQEIDGTASKLADIVRNAKSSAGSRIQCPDGTIATGWNVILNDNSYTMNCLTPASQQVFTSPYAATPTDSTTFQMTNDRCPAGQALTLNFAAQDVTYECGAVAGTTWPITITIRNTAGTTTRQLIIERGGIVRGG